MFGLETYASSFVYCSCATKQVWFSVLEEPGRADKEVGIKVTDEKGQTGFCRWYHREEDILIFEFVV
jgi:hypothetical protein